MKMHIAKTLSLASSFALTLAACSIALPSLADAAPRAGARGAGHASHAGGRGRGGAHFGGGRGHGGYGYDGGYGGYGGGYLGVCGPIQLTLGLCGPWGY